MAVVVCCSPLVAVAGRSAVGGGQSKGSPRCSRLAACGRCSAVGGRCLSLGKRINEPLRICLRPENPGKILPFYRCPIAFHQRSVPGAVVGLSVSNLRPQKRLGRTQRSAFRRDRHCHSHPQPRSGSPCGGVLNLIGFRDPGKVHLPEGWATPCGSNYGRA